MIDRISDKKCFVCEEKTIATDTDFRVYRTFAGAYDYHFHNDCLDLETIDEEDKFKKCIICRKKLELIPWYDKPDNDVVFVEFWSNNHGWWKICKPCFDRDIGIV